MHMAVQALPANQNARKHNMESELERLIESILQEAKEPVAIPYIETTLAGKITADTFDVRDAVWRLVAKGRAEFTPKRYVVKKVAG
jgi:hypothetical protein